MKERWNNGGTFCSSSKAIFKYFRSSRSFAALSWVLSEIVIAPDGGFIVDTLNPTESPEKATYERRLDPDK